MNSTFVPIWGAILLVSIVFNTVEAGEKIVIKGSDTLGAKLVPTLAEAYQAAGNEVEFEIAAEGSSTAFTNLLVGTCDIGMASREAKPKEIAAFQAKGLELTRHVAAADMIGVIVNESNPLRNLTSKQVEGIFTGEITDWKEVGGVPGEIFVFIRNTSSGTYKSFQEMAMSGREYGEETQKIPGSESIPHVMVHFSDGKNAIGYAGLAYARSEGIKPLAIDGVTISAETHTSYPITRHLLYYTVGEVRGAVAEFLGWATTDSKALEIVESVGFVPIQTDDTDGEIQRKKSENSIKKP